MIKFRFYFDKEQETKWLNKMSEEGFAMKWFFAGLFGFEKCEKGKYLYQVDFSDKPFSASNDYKEFMEDTGVEIVQTWGFWVILRKAASEGAFQLYTDLDSSINHYMKILKMFKIATIVELLCFFAELFAGINGVSVGYPLALLLGLFAIACANAAIQTKNKIAELKEQQNGTVAIKRNSVHLLVPIGLLLNSCALILGESIAHPIKTTIQIIAIIFMLTGLFFTCQERKNS